jgi:hypothetical protein
MAGAAAFSAAVFVNVAMGRVTAPAGNGLLSTGWHVVDRFVAEHWFAGANDAGSGYVAGLENVCETVNGGFCPSSFDADAGATK